MAVGYNLAFAVFCGPAPMVSTWLIHRTGVLTAPAFYLLLLAAMSMPAYLALRGGAPARIETRTSSTP